MNLGLKEKIALVTGGYSGLGKAICISLASEGTHIAINYRKSTEKAQELANEIKDKFKVKAIIVQGDITAEEDVKRIFAETISCFSRLDILINNSGVCPVSMIKDTTLTEWENVMRTNLTGTFLTSREMINQLVNTKRTGNIVNIASQTAFNGSKSGKTHYSASKGGVVTFTLSLAKEIAHYGIRVNAVAPGMMYTEMTAATLDSNMDRYKNEIPLGRVAEVNEIANVVTFLCSEASSYMTGTTVDACGGTVGR